MFLGYVFLGERLRFWQRVSVAIAGAGVVYLVLSYGELPWIALVLLTTFGVYGLLRKITPVGSLVGLNFESAVLCPVSLVYLLVFDGARDAGRLASPE